MPLALTAELRRATNEEILPALSLAPGASGAFPRLRPARSERLYVRLASTGGRSEGDYSVRIRSARFQRRAGRSLLGRLQLAQDLVPRNSGHGGILSTAGVLAYPEFLLEGQVN